MRSMGLEEQYNYAKKQVTQSVKDKRDEWTALHSRLFAEPLEYSRVSLRQEREAGHLVFINWLMGLFLILLIVLLVFGVQASNNQTFSIDESSETQGMMIRQSTNV